VPKISENRQEFGQGLEHRHRAGFSGSRVIPSFRLLLESMQATVPAIVGLALSWRLIRQAFPGDAQADVVG
jgi:hypothetical protein